MPVDNARSATLLPAAIGNNAARLRSEAVSAICDDLLTYARRHGGRYIVHESSARNALRHDSDLDLLVDFPEAALADAWRFAEAACGRRDVPFDIMPLSWCSEGFLRRIASTARSLP
jgi:hypothetical protein